MSNKRRSRYKLKLRYKLKPASLLAIYKRFRHHLRAHSATAVLAGLCMIGATAMELIKPWPLKFIFDGLLIPQQATDTLVSRALEMAGTPDMLLAASVAGMLLIAVLAGLFGFGQSYLLASIGQKVVAAIRQELYSHVQRLSLSFHLNQSSGDLLARLTEDVRMMRDLLVNSGVFLAARSLIVVGTIVVMALMDWRLTLVALAVVPLLLLSSMRFSSAIKGAARRQRRKESKITQVMNESLGAIRVVQAYAREAHEDARFSKQNAASAKASLVATKLEANLDRVVQVMLAAGLAAVVWYGVFRIRAGAITPGDLLVFTAYLTTLYKPIRKSAALTGRIAKATVCGERILALLDTVPEIANKPDAKPAPPFRGEVRLEDVTFGYGDGSPVLDGANLKICAGETVALVSPSGTGKSTLANLVLRFYDPSKGRVSIDGTDVRDVTLESLRDQISVVLQDSILFADTIRNNIAYGRPDASEDDIIEAARAANADAFIRSLPEGYDTVVGERGATLSGGQRQRIAIARAIVRNAPILIVDEPMTGLDGANEQAVREAFAKVMKDRTSIIISHDLLTASLADRVLKIRRGKIVEVELERVVNFEPASRGYEGELSHEP